MNTETNGSYTLYILYTDTLCTHFTIYTPYTLYITLRFHRFSLISRIREFQIDSTSIALRSAKDEGDTSAETQGKSEILVLQEGEEKRQAPSFKFEFH